LEAIHSLKISCDATCERCYHEKGRRQDLNENDLILFCTSCKRVYLCDIGLARLGNNFHCPFDNTVIIQEEVDKSIIQMKGLPGEDQSFSEEIHHRLVGDKKLKEKRGVFSRSSSKTRTLTAYHRSKISELSDIKNLTQDLLLEIAKYMDVQNITELKEVKSKKDLLDHFGRENVTLIDSLYSILHDFEESIIASKIRFAIFIPSIIQNYKSISLSNDRQYFDIKIKDSNDNEYWVFCSDKYVDLKDIENLTERATKIDFLNYPSINSIFFVAKKFSYVAKEMIKKYQSVSAGIEQTKPNGSIEITRSIPVILFEWIPNSNRFEKTPLF
jgi:hypothetical protein